ncbi:hypothetical protein ABIA18_005209 [Sinorhizobium fredii]
MRRAEGIVFAFGAPGEAGQAAFLAQRADAIAPPGQDLVWIALVADVEDQPVMRRVEDLVDGDRQFDDAEAGAEMAAGARHRIDHLRTQFACQLRQVPVVDPLEIVGDVDLVEQRRRRHRIGWQLCHAACLVRAEGAARGLLMISVRWLFRRNPG